jgi:UDPglucose 6-dehydrogenase
LRIAVIGMGYVGITTAASLGELGHQVIGVDIDELKIEQLKKGELSIYEPLVETTIQKLIRQSGLHFTTSMKEAVEGSEVLFLTVGTPSLPDGRPNMTYIEAAAIEIGRHMTKYSVIVDKSTVPVGTTDDVQSIITKQLKLRELRVDFDVVSNPEFLQEGKALQNAIKPDRIILGCSSPKAAKIMLEMYEKVEAPILVTNPRAAEMIKYASNALLATKISFINEIARLCDRSAVDVSEVAKGMGMDNRIGPSFLQAGIGYGGSCFPKDVAALIAMGRETSTDTTLLESVHEVNQTQMNWFLDQVKQGLGGLNGKRITLLGMAFKPDTDDIREAPSLKIIAGFLNEGAVINGFDPVVNNKVKDMFPRVTVSEDAYQAVEEADAVVLCTEWKEIINLDWREIKSLMRGDFIFDGRNALDRTMLRTEGFRYWGVGRDLCQETT